MQIDAKNQKPVMQIDAKTMVRTVPAVLHLIVAKWLLELNLFSLATFN